MKVIQQQSEQGFVAIVSAIVISAILVIIGASLGYSGFFTRFNILDAEFKSMSLGLAEACAEIARVEIANNAGYTATDRDYVVGTDSYCTVVSVDNDTDLVRTQGVVNDSYSNIEADFLRTGSDVIVESWLEKAKF